MLDVYHETAMTNIHTRCLTAKSYTVRHSQTVSVKAEGGGGNMGLRYVTSPMHGWHSYSLLQPLPNRTYNE